MRPFVASTLYSSMIRPIALYCYPVLLGISNTLNDKLELIQVRASRIVAQPGNIQLHMDSLKTIGKRRSVVDVFKALNHIGKQSNEVMFERVPHRENTCRNGSFAKLPKIHKSCAY